jgi:hypothetical protein
VDAARAGSARCRNNGKNPACWSQRDIWDRLGPPAQHSLDQRPRRAEHRDPEIPLWHHADVRPLELDLTRKRDRDSAGCSEITLVTGEDLVERAKAADEQAMRVPILRRAGPRCGKPGQPVALQDVDPLKVFGQGAGGRQPTHSRSNNDGPLTQLAGTVAVPPRR